jgi:predicted methyltransferase
VHALGSPKGDVLDTATGLGYAAIGLAEQARRVVTIERDPAVRELCRWNPWSEELFSSDHIELLLGDSAELIPDMADEAFGAILHDPPSMSLAGDLYGGPFYRQLYRILKPDGRLFHYIGDPKSAFGNSVTKGVIRRLGEAGFVKIEPKTRAFGIVAHKAGRVLRGRRKK